MRLKKIACVIAAAGFLSAASSAAPHIHNGESCPLYGDTFMTPEGVAPQKAAQKRLAHKLWPQRRD